MKILSATLLVFAALIVWAFLDMYQATGQQIRITRQILDDSGSLEDLEEAIGRPNREYSGTEIPDYLASKEGFQRRDGTTVFVYQREGIPYWWVLVQVNEDDSEIVWYLVDKR
jgi:hypothetical protein